MSGFVAGKVLASKNASWKENDLFGASLPFSTYLIVTPEHLAATLFWKLTDFITESQISYGIGVLGMPGATVYGGLVDTLRPKKGETIFISAAAGAVGGMVGQLAK
jgi:NADPH-dependent curcumin reductase CurA